MGSRADAVRAALAVASIAPRLKHGARLYALRPSGGGTNQVYRISTARGVLYAKVRLDDCASSKREVWALGALGGALAPRLLATGRLDAVGPVAALDASLGGDVLFMTAVPGVTRRRLAEADLRALATTLVRLHRHRPRRGPTLGIGGDVYELLAVLRRGLSALAAARLVSAPALRALRALYRRAQRRLRDDVVALEPTPRCLCHGDLRGPNLLFADDGGVGLVDFEYAGRGDPMIDLACFAADEELSRHAELVLLDAYEHAGGGDVSRYFSYRVVAPLAVAVASAVPLARARLGKLPDVTADRLADRARRASRRLSALVGDDVRLRSP